MNTKEKFNRWAATKCYLNDNSAWEAWRACSEEYEKDIHMIATAYEEVIASMQSKLDSIMLEYCPEDMTLEQIDNWEEHQRQTKIDLNDPRM